MTSTGQGIRDGAFIDPRRRRRIVTSSLVVTDIVMLILATLAATALRFNSLLKVVDFEDVGITITFWQLSFVLSAMWFVFLAAEGLYDIEGLFWGAGELRRVARSLALGVVAFILVTFALKMPGLSRAWTLIAWSLAVLFVWLGRLGVRYWLARQRERGRMLRRTLIVGTNAEAAELVAVLRAAPSTGLVPVGCLAATQADRLGLDYVTGTVPILGFARELGTIVNEAAIDTVVIATSAFEHEVISRMVAELRGQDVSIHISSGLLEVLTSRLWVREVAGVPLITVKRVSLSRLNLAVKRAFDITVATLVLVLGLPVWLLVALAVLLTSRGPVFYRQRRLGQYGREFDMLKFRSMVADAEQRQAELEAHNEVAGAMFKMKDDPRVTKVGALLRKFSIDEMPQILNVLKGEMSLVGPRPPLPGEVTRYTPHDWRRLEVPPGMTGLWQVSGRSRLSFAEMVRLDLFYIENWSLALDISLIMRTVPAVLFARGAY